MTGARSLFLFEMHIKREINKQTIKKFMTVNSEKEKKKDMVKTYRVNALKIDCDVFSITIIAYID